MLTLSVDLRRLLVLLVVCFSFSCEKRDSASIQTRGNDPFGGISIADPNTANRIRSSLMDAGVSVDIEQTADGLVRLIWTHDDLNYLKSAVCDALPIAPPVGRSSAMPDRISAQRFVDEMKKSHLTFSVYEYQQSVYVVWLSGDRGSVAEIYFDLFSSPEPNSRLQRPFEEVRYECEPFAEEDLPGTVYTSPYE